MGWTTSSLETETGLDAAGSELEGGDDRRGVRMMRRRGLMQRGYGWFGWGKGEKSVRTTLHGLHERAGKAEHESR